MADHWITQFTRNLRSHRPLQIAAFGVVLALIVALLLGVKWVVALVAWVLENGGAALI